ncbi:hypothetical protein AB0K14_26130 [Actinosynnema sp. NPDC050801]|uniref:hypothetical protein n=1 Tax=unclassified Actinosynnema TaxID=2637065 RepID=UPI0033D7B30A
MSILVLAGVVTVVAALLYVVLAVLSRRPKPAEREVRAALPGLEIDPFHALTVRSKYSGAMDDDAVATLLLDDLVTIDAEGMMTVTERGRDPRHVPAHPVPAAWLGAVARAGRPVALSEVRRDPELRERCEAFVREQNARHARWMRPVPDRAATAALIVTWLLGFFYAALLLFSGGRRPPGGIAGGLGLTLLLGVLFTALLSWLVSRAFPDPPELFREHCAGLPRHPATGLLGSDRRALLRVSSSYKTEYELHQQRIRDAYDSDSGGF